MATLFSDNFNRADSTDLGANWTETAGDVSIVTNQLNCVTTTGIPQTTTTAMAAVADMKVSVKKITNSDIGGPIARATDTATYYMAYAGAAGVSSNTDIYRFPSVTLIASRNGTINSNDIIQLRTQGSTLQWWVAGAQVGADITDTNITGAGQAGMYIDTTSAKFDDFLVEDVGVSAGPFPPWPQWPNTLVRM